MKDSFASHGTLAVGGESLKIARLAALEKRGYDLSRLPYALKILLENLLRNLSAGVLAFDRDFRMRSANHSAAVILQQPISELQGLTFDEWRDRQPAQPVGGPAWQQQPTPSPGRRRRS